MTMRCGFLFLALVLSGCGTTSSTGSRPEPDQTDLDYPVGAFSLTERSGRTVTDQDLLAATSGWPRSFSRAAMDPVPK